MAAAKGGNMQQVPVPIPLSNRQVLENEHPGKIESSLSGISWAAVIGGAFASASLALILLSLGTGLGFSAVSPWSILCLNPDDRKGGCRLANFHLNNRLGDGWISGRKTAYEVGKRPYGKAIFVILLTDFVWAVDS